VVLSDSGVLRNDSGAVFSALLGLDSVRQPS
jgi:hypothetical protein